MRINRRHDGFTLLELMVSIALTTVVFTILFGGLRLVESARGRGERKLDAIAQELALTEQIHVQVSSAVPRILTMDYEGQSVRLLSLRGSSKEVRFLTHSAWTGERNYGLWLATYRAVEEPPGREQLVITEGRISGDRQLVASLRASEARGASTMSIGQTADRIEFTYLRPSSPGKPAAWVPEWKAEDEQRLPRAIQVRWSRGKQEQTLTLMIPAVDEVK